MTINVNTVSTVGNVCDQLGDSFGSEQLGKPAPATHHGKPHHHHPHLLKAMVAQELQGMHKAIAENTKKAHEANERFKKSINGQS